MIRETSVIGLAALTMLAASPRAQSAPTSVTLRLQSGTVSLSGTSNLRSFACRTPTIDARINVTLDSAVDQDSTARPTLTGPSAVHASVEIALQSLDCGLPGVKRDLIHTLRGDLHPLINYRLDSAEVVAGSAGPDSLRANTMGTLTVAGVPRAVPMLVSGRRLSDGRLEATGTLVINMSDFGITPPRLFFGTLRVHDTITIQFDLTTEVVGDLR